MPDITGTHAVNDLEFVALSDFARGVNKTVREIAAAAIAEKVRSITEDFEQNFGRQIPEVYRKATIEERVQLIATLKAIASR